MSKKVIYTKSDFKANFVRSTLLFETNKLESHKPETLLVSKSLKTNYTVFDAHIDGLSNNLGGAQCHFFIDSVGDIYEALDSLSASSRGKGLIVVTIECNSKDDLKEPQIESLKELAEKLNEDLSIKALKLDSGLTKDNFPVKEIENLLK
ncbi:hypothetical protein Bp8pS_151 [Bacillus phage vB_BpuM-BpSp]|nr:hypothetical protein Bp8pS_151 [Bacillus phage vB_BpuM-BpSp]